MKIASAGRSKNFRILCVKLERPSLHRASLVLIFFFHLCLSSSPFLLHIRVHILRFEMAVSRTRVPPT